MQACCKRCADCVAAVFVTPAPPGCASVSCSGSLAEQAAKLAGAAPGQRTQRAVERRDAAGTLFYEVETLVGGGTAGRFGAAVEVLGTAVVDGRQVQVRATASYSSWNRAGTRALLRACVSSAMLRRAAA